MCFSLASSDTNDICPNYNIHVHVLSLSFGFQTENYFIILHIYQEDYSGKRVTFQVFKNSLLNR